MMRPPARAQPFPLRPDEVVSDERLAALDALPVCAQIVTYEAPTPRTFWANRLYLSLMGMTLEELLAQARPLIAVGCPPRRSLSLKLSDTRVYEPQLRARLGTTAHFCEPQPPTLAKGWCIGWQTVEAVSSIQYAIDRFRNLKP